MEYDLQLEKKATVVFLERKTKKKKLTSKLTQKIQELEKKILFFNNFIASNESDDNIDEIINHIDNAIKTINFLVISNGVLVNKKNNTKTKNIECEI